MGVIPGIALSVLTALALAWKWQLGAGRVGVSVLLLGALCGAVIDLAVRAPPVVQALSCWGLTLACAAGVLVFRFYRDPDRVPPDSPNVIVSPADGVIVYVRRSEAGVLPVATKKGTGYPLVELTKTPLASGDAVVVGISMSFLDVHVNRAPIDGTVSFLRHFPGRFGSLRRTEMIFENERATTVIEKPGLQIAVVQIASRLVRQIAVFLKAGQDVRLGQKLGVIRLGSQVDVVLPARRDMAVSVRVGDHVKAGESIIAVLQPEEGNAAAPASGAPRTIRAGRAVKVRARPAGALVIGGDYRGLCVARSLGRHGVPVWIMAAAGDVLAAASRWRARVLPWPAGDEAGEVAFLLEAAKKHGLDGWVLIPTADETAALLARHAAALSTAFVLTTPSWEVMRWAYDKRLTYELAGAAGVDGPLTLYPFNAREVAHYRLKFPVILKPAVKDRDNELTRDKAWRVDDRNGLLSRYEEACRLVPPEYVMVQEFIPGGGEAQFSFAALCEDGRVLASLTARRTRQYPPDFGHSSSFVETVERPEIEAAATRALEHISYSGLVEVEFKYDRRDGKYKLLDINPRVWTWHALGARAGVDFPWLLWLNACGEPVPRLRGRPGVKWVRMSTDVPSALAGMARGDLSLGRYLGSFRGHVQLALFAADDPLPALVELPATLGRRAVNVIKGLRLPWAAGEEGSCSKHS